MRKGVDGNGVNHSRRRHGRSNEQRRRRQERCVREVRGRRAANGGLVTIAAAPWHGRRIGRRRSTEASRGKRRRLRVHAVHCARSTRHWQVWRHERFGVYCAEGDAAGGEAAAGGDAPAAAAAGSSLAGCRWRCPRWPPPCLLSFFGCCAFFSPPAAGEAEGSGDEATGDDAGAAAEAASAAAGAAAGLLRWFWFCLRG